MGQFKVERKDEGGKPVLEISGQIDEDAVFANVDISSDKELTLDLENVSAINSCGIREWIKWIKTGPSDGTVVYKNCPKVIVDQINMVAGFLPENGRVESFYVPYYCDSNGNEKMVLFKSGVEFKDGELNPPEEVKDDDSGDEMEMDVIEAKYFKFLNK